MRSEHGPHPGPPPPPPGTLRPGQSRPVLPPQPPPPPFAANATAALRAAAATSGRAYREPHRQPGSWPPRVAGRTISERAMAVGAVVLVVVIGAGALLATWSPSGRPGVANAPTTRPFMTPSGSPSQAPVYLAVGDSPSPYPSPDPVLTPSTPPGAKVLRIGISLPLSGTWSADGGPARDAVLAAIQNAGKIGGYTIEPVVLDYAEGGTRHPDKAGRDMQSFTEDPTIVGVVGPLDSDAAAAELPVSNAAGLLECSPGAADATLTRGQIAKMLNGVNPDKLAFLRVAATTDGQATAMAKWARDRLKGSVLVISDSTTMGRALAREFEAAYQHAGGVVADNVDSTVSSDGFAAALAGQSRTDFTGVFLGSTNSRAAAILRQQMNGLSDSQTYLLTTDAAYDNPWPGASWYLGQAGETGAAYTRAARSVWTDFTGSGAFNAWLKSTTHRDPGAYSATAFACTQVILDAIGKAAAAQGPVTREEIRQIATSRAAAVQTMLGPITFSPQGDVTTQLVTVYAPDPGAATPFTWTPDLHYEVGLCPTTADGPCFAPDGG